MIDRLHYSLWMNTGGLWLMGIVAAVWLATSFIGLALAWPRVWLRIVGWFPILSARVNRGSYHTNYQLHRAAGVWFLPVLIILAFTSLYQNLPQFIRPLVHAISPLAETPAGAPLPEGAPIVSPDRAVESLKARLPAPIRAASDDISRAGATRSSFTCPATCRRRARTGRSWTRVQAMSSVSSSRPRRVRAISF
jgi:uncharacterized iron-regulated membrane protein